MATTTTHAPGTFCWAELATSDQQGAKRFYTSLFGWTADDTDMGNGQTYTILKKDGKDAAALYTMDDAQKKQGIPPNWLQYVAVESADQAAAKAKELGGKVMMEPFDVHDMGRMSVMQDPTGAVFAVWQANKQAGVGVLNEPGALTWDELLTNDTKKAGAFYTALFPWKTEKTPMPNMDYTLFKRGDAMAGGMFEIRPEMGPMPPNWTVYFQVEDADATAAKAVGLGAKVVMPPTDVPNVGRFAVIQDPQGAAVAFIAYPNRG